MKRKSVVVTGAGGFIGSHLCEHYLQLGYRVIGIDNFSTGSRSNQDLLSRMSAQMIWIEADVCCPWENFLKDDSIDFVFHFASPASPPHYQRLAIETMEVNSIGLAHAMQFADRCQAKVIFASTSEVYGDPECSPQAETYWGHVNSYGVRACYDESKRFGEALIFSYNQKHHTRHGLVRIFNTYGPRMNLQDGRVVINLLTQAWHGHRLTLYGQGQQSRSFCYIDDLIQGIVRYAEKDLVGPINLGNDTELTVLELAHLIQKLFNKTLEFEFLPLPQDDPQQRRPQLDLAKQKLAPWVPKIPLEEGLLRMIAWLKNDS